MVYETTDSPYTKNVERALDHQIERRGRGHFIRNQRLLT